MGNQFEILFPGSTYDLLDVFANNDGCAPYNSMKRSYKHLSANPTQWKLVYEMTNNKPAEIAANLHIKLACERRFRERIKSYNPDVVVSVHPMMNKVPATACSRISQETGKHLPIFTVVTDLASCHITWFSKEVENIYVASDEIYNLAIKKGGIMEEKLMQIGLPIRHQFAEQAELLGDRMSQAGQAYQLSLRDKLGLQHPDKRTILVMGGGEGVGSLSAIVDALFIELSKKGVDAKLLVICGRNEKLKHDLEYRDWDITVSQMRLTHELPLCWAPPIVPSQSSCLNENIATKIKRIVSKRTMLDAIEDPLPSDVSSSDSQPEDEHFQECTVLGQVDVVGLGFVTNMAEYMAASDVLVTKAGPGTIAEAAAVGLPVMLTSFLPGQEEGNADFVIDKNFGTLIPDYDPVSIAEEVCNWLLDDQRLTEMSRAASAAGAPKAAAEIAKRIGESTLRWRETEGSDHSIAINS